MKGNGLSISLAALVAIALGSGIALTQMTSPGDAPNNNPATTGTEDIGGAMSPDVQSPDAGLFGEEPAADPTGQDAGLQGQQDQAQQPGQTQDTMGAALENMPYDQRNQFEDQVNQQLDQLQAEDMNLSASEQQEFSDIKNEIQNSLENIGDISQSSWEQYRQDITQNLNELQQFEGGQEEQAPGVGSIF